MAAVLVVGACSGGGGTTATAGLDDGLRRDLQLAAAASVELATNRDASTARFVSAAEGQPRGEGRETTVADRRGTARHRAPTKGVRRVADVRPAPAVAEEPAPTVAMVEAPAAVGVEDTPTPTPAPAVVPAPVDERPVAVGRGDEGVAQGDRDEGDRGRRGRGGGGWGGVIIRGGMGDIDHCERDAPGRRGGMGGGMGGGVQGAINRRFPGLPNGGWGGPMGGAAGTILRQVATQVGRPR
ncbi:hypothetical protein rosag_35280 [Roseisolibacter agri]|uniref:Uncharacterized protein n=2 Tax=Roseisolibacter agri TaxID=2014610 RepID=A0AA37QIA5_9BACT|nr:hypothetical protein rosag_35280 [Roseisolibacter agri]